MYKHILIRHQIFNSNIIMEFHYLEVNLNLKYQNKIFI